MVRRDAKRSEKPARGERPAARKKPARASDKARGSVHRAPAKAPRAAKPKPRSKARATDARSQARAAHEYQPHPLADAGAFPIVGIGASAGGLEALELFLTNVPEKSGAAFVVVQHLDPTHKGMLVELLQRSTAMPVAQATDRLAVERDHVYVIPPSNDMSLLHGRLHLLPHLSPRGLRLPIDYFFRSLAEDQRERSIGVILSGMGSDGTLGLRAIKEKAGAAFVQALSSAKFDGMPSSAIDAGLADVIAPVEELPARIIAYRRHMPHFARPDLHAEDETRGALEKVCLLLRAQTGNDFSQYKSSTIHRRIERRMGLHQIDSVAHYVRYLQENPREADLLFKELLIGVTSFFRDPAVWEQLKREVIPALVSSRSSAGVLRAWVAGCSTGEEAYSLAIVFKEAMEPFQPMRHVALQVFATDLDHEAIEKARHALYPDSIAADVSAERLQRFFVHEERGYRVSKDVREMVVFAPQNIITDPPFTKLDILSCRNLLIYLSSDLQKKLIPRFHYSLNPGGVLVLGSSETIGGFTNLFGPLDGKTRLYRRLDHSIADVPVEFASPPTFPGAASAAGGARYAERSAQGAPSAPDLQALADRVIAQQFSPVAVLCNDKGDVLYISGRAGKYLEPAVGKSSASVFAMAREGLRHPLTTAFTAVVRHGRAVTVRDVAVRDVAAHKRQRAHVVDFTIRKLDEPRDLRGSLMIVFNDVPSAPRSRVRTSRHAESSPRVTALMKELREAREEVQTAHEEMQTSQEELKSANEELQSTNEELQSSNEELTTSKEEMQSLNEELQTVNQELLSKVDELSRANNDMKNLLNSTNIATLFLDDELNVRRFTTPTAKIIKLIATDIGRPITDIASDLDYADLADDAHEVLRTLVFKERHVATRDGRYFAVRIMPYRTLENVIDGVVITFTDAGPSRALAEALREQVDQLLQMEEALPSLVWTCRPDGASDHFSRRWIEYTGAAASEHLGYGWIEQIHPDDRDRARDAWRAAIRAGATFDVELRLRNASGEYHRFRSRSIPIRDARGTIVKWFGTHTDIDEGQRDEPRHG